MNPNEPLPLSGVRVADFSWFGAGPIAGLVFANLGAEVIRVESETHMDGLRMTQPIPEGKEGPNVSGYYNNFNAGKLSFTLNLDLPAAREVALDLIPAGRDGAHADRAGFHGPHGRRRGERHHHVPGAA